MSRGNDVLVSVIMAVYNEEKFLIDAIRSVQAQTEEMWELVIVDDFSSDGSYAIAETEAEKDSRIIVMKNPGKGKVSAFNSAVERASGRYVHLFAGDDVLDSKCLERCVQKLMETGLGAVFHELQRVDENLKPLPDRLVGGALAEHTLDQALTEYSYAVPSGLWFFEKETFSKAWPIPDHVPYEDVWLAVCFRSEGRVTYLPERLYLYRQHENQTYGRSSDVSLKTYKFRMARLGKSFESIVTDEEFSSKLAPKTVAFCKQQIQFAEILCSKSRSPLKVMLATLPFKRRISIAVAWYAPWVWSWLRQKAVS